MSEKSELDIQSEINWAEYLGDGEPEEALLKYFLDVESEE